MRLVATAVGGGIAALIALAITKAIMGTIVGGALFLLGLFFKILLAALAVWLGVRLLKSLLKPAKPDTTTP